MVKTALNREKGRLNYANSEIKWLEVLENKDVFVNWMQISCALF